ncbi:MAG: beta-phosphoglucomutase family hydrolase [Solirubrobacterales bacterium]
MPPVTRPPEPGSGAALGLPADITTCLFDLDGVLTKTAVVHAAAWKQMFDEFLAGLDAAQQPFDGRADYDRYVDGKPRYDGVRSFLQSRSIELPEGEPSDPPSANTICGLGNRKNDLVQELIERDGVEAYPGSVEYVAKAKAAGLQLAVVSSSANCKAILKSCGMLDSFQEIMDGEVAAERGIKGKPAPDTFLAAAAALGAEPAQATVYEDALAGVQSGRSGNFGFVVGVDRVGQADALKEHGADVVVQDLKELMEQG